MFDISLCSAEYCPKYNACVRGDGEKHNPGVYTMSDFSNECNELNNYAWMIPSNYDWEEKL